MTFNIKRILLSDEFYFSFLFYKTIVLFTHENKNSFDIEAKIKFNILGFLLLNPFYIFWKILYNGIKEFHFKKIGFQGYRKVFSNIPKSYFTEEEQNFLRLFPEYIDH